MTAPDMNWATYVPPSGPRMVEMQYMVGKNGFNTARSFQLPQVIQNPILASGAMDLESMMAQLNEELSNQAKQTKTLELERSPQKDMYKSVDEVPVEKTLKKPAKLNGSLTSDVKPVQEAASKVEAKPEKKSEAARTQKQVPSNTTKKKKKGTLKLLNDNTGDPLLDGLTGRVNNTLTETIYSAVDIPSTMLKWGAGGFALGELIQVGNSLRIKSKTGHWVKQLTKKGRQLKKWEKMLRLGVRFTLLPTIIGVLFSVGGGLMAATKAAASLTGAALLNPTSR